MNVEIKSILLICFASIIAYVVGFNDHLNFYAGIFVGIFLFKLAIGIFEETGAKENKENSIEDFVKNEAVEQIKFVKETCKKLNKVAKK